MTEWSDIIFMYLKERLSELDSKIESINLDKETELRDLCVDSLKLVEVVYYLEKKLGVTIDESAMLQIETVGDLISALKDAGGPQLDAELRAEELIN